MKYKFKAYREGYGGVADEVVTFKTSPISAAHEYLAKRGHYDDASSAESIDMCSVIVEPVGEHSVSAFKWCNDGDGPFAMFQITARIDIDLDVEQVHP